MKTITRSLPDVVETVSGKTQFSKKDVETVLRSVLDTVKDELVAGNDVNFNNFGKFSTTQREARVGRNPSTGAEVQIAASTSVKFKAGKALKDAF